MRLFGWIRKMLRRQAPPQEAIQARVLARRITQQADRLGESLTRYKEARDPFAAIMADFYNRDQVDRIWHGRPHD